MIVCACSEERAEIDSAVGEVTALGSNAIIADPVIVQFVDDYRRLKQGITKGTAKRKAAPSKKAPLKKAKTTTRKKQDKAAEVKARAMSPDSSNEDQMEFLRGLANQSLNL